MKFRAQQNEEIDESLFIDEIYPIVKIIVIGLQMGRILLLALSSKNIKICQFYFYYNILTIIIEQALLTEDDLSLSLSMPWVLIQNVINYWFFYVNSWWTSLICSQTTLISLMLFRREFLKEDTDIQ